MSSTFRSSESHDHILIVIIINMKKLKIIGTIIIIKDILQEFKIFNDNGDLKGLAKSFCVPTEGLEGKDEKVAKFYLAGLSPH